MFIAYAMGAVLAWKFFGSEAGPAFFYPPAGVTVAAMMLTRRSQWPPIVAAILLGEALVDLYFGNAPAVAAGYSLANAAEPLVGASLTMRWCRGAPDLRDRRDLAAFGAGACLLGPGMGGLIGGSTAHLYDGSGWLTDVLNWWVGDGLGVLVVGTPILLWARQSAIVRSRPVETAAVLGLTAAVSALAFWANTPPSILILPLLAWAALRLDMLGAALAGGVVAFVATIMTSRGSGAFRAWDIGQGNQLMVTQLFVGVVMTVALVVAQEAAARISAVAEREAERSERVRLEGLSRLAQQLSAALEPADIERVLHDHVVTDAGARGVSLGLLSRDGRRLERAAMVGYPQEAIDHFGPGVALEEPWVATDTVRSARPVLIRNVEEYESRFGANVRWLGVDDVQSMAGWPLAAGGKPFGALVLTWQEPQSFDASQLAYVSAVATMVSQALVRARVYADEHARAAVLQSALVPDSPGDTAGLDVCAVYEPADVAEGLGGDWYDVMSLPGGRTYFAVGDVIGHGLPAVEDMAQLRTAGRTLAYQGLPPGRLLAELNGFTRHASRGKFATMSVAVFDPEAATLTYCSAGHPPPLLRRGSTGEVIRLGDSEGPVMGPIEAARYLAVSVEVFAGDVLVMYTDGLVERRGVDIDTGISDAQRLIGDWRADTALAEDCASLQESLAPRPRRDDVCLIAVRFTLPGCPTARPSSR